MAETARSPTYSRYVSSPWSLRAWPAVLCQAHTSIGFGFRHLSTCVVYTKGGVELPQGQTFWAVQAPKGDAGMAWDWVQIAQGVIAIADPFSLVSNLRFVGERGELLSTTESARILNALVHELPWQKEVHKALGAALN